MKIYIISYFGPREAVDVRADRVKTHKEQCEWFIAKGHQPVVLNQDFSDDEFMDGVIYVGDNSRHNACEARNLLFKEFYASDDLYACFADNDAIYKDTLFTYDPLHKVDEYAKDLKGRVDLLFAVNPIVFPFNKEINENRKLYDSRFVFQKTTVFKESLFVMTNFKKVYDEEYYFEGARFTGKNGEMLAGEGTDFVFDLLSHKRSALMYKQLIMHEKTSTSTWNVEKDQERYRIPDELKQYWMDKYSIPFSDKNLKPKQFIGMVSTGKKKVYRTYLNEKGVERDRNRKSTVEMKVYKLPIAMDNYSIVEWLKTEEAEAMDSDLRAFPEKDLVKLSVVRKLNHLYEHISKTVYRNIPLVAEDKLKDFE